jgi:hypothetical protein
MIISKIRSGNIKKFNDIPKNLRMDKDVFTEIIAFPDKRFYDLQQKDFDVFGIDFLLEMLDSNFLSTVGYLSYCPIYRDDIRVAKKVISKEKQYHYLFPKIHSDEDFAVEIIKDFPEIFELPNFTLKNNRRVMVEYLFASSGFYCDEQDIKKLLIKGKK